MPQNAKLISVSSRDLGAIERLPRPYSFRDPSHLESNGIKKKRDASRFSRAPKAMSPQPKGSEGDVKGHQGHITSRIPPIWKAKENRRLQKIKQTLYTG
jgi:hypothetical protein